MGEWEHRWRRIGRRGRPRGDTVAFQSCKLISGVGGLQCVSEVTDDVTGGGEKGGRVRWWYWEPFSPADVTVSPVKQPVWLMFEEPRVWSAIVGQYALIAKLFIFLNDLSFLIIYYFTNVLWVDVLKYTITLLCIIYIIILLYIFYR